MAGIFDKFGTIGEDYIEPAMEGLSQAGEAIATTTGNVVAEVAYQTETVAGNATNEEQYNPFSRDPWGVGEEDTPTPDDYTGMTPEEADIASIGNSNGVGYDKEEGALYGIDLNNLVKSYENKLLKYHNPTWRFSLFALNTEDYVNYLDSPIDNVQKYIIAQSGNTGRYSINTVRINNVAPATPGLTTNFSINDATVEIYENGGMKLTDDIIMMSNMLGYNKFADVPLVLELDFIGYDQDTGQPMVIPNTHRRWGIRINNIQSAATQSGGVIIHTISLTSNRSILNNNVWTIGESLSCVSSTFGDFLDVLEEKYNKMAYEQYGYLRTKFADFSDGKYYEIICADDLRSMGISYDSKETSETTNTKSGSNGSKQFTWNPKTAFSKIIDDVLDGCLPPVDADISTGTRRQFVHVVPFAKYIGFDDNRNSSAYKYYFYIIPYKIGDVLDDLDLTNERFNLEYFLENAESMTDPETGENKLNIKRYDYQFTGENSEIINLDLKFDQQFLIAVNRNPQTLVDMDNSTGTHIKQPINIGGRIYDKDNPASRAAMWDRKIELERKMDNETITPEERIEHQVLSVGSMNIPDEETPNVEGEDEQQQQNLQSQRTNDIYLEDFRQEVDLTTEAHDGIGQHRRMDHVPLDTTEDKAINSGTESTENDVSKRKIRDNYYNRSFLVKLDMKVVGDPYWLGWSDYAYMDYVRALALGDYPEFAPEDFDYANFLTSEAYLLLNLRPPASISDETGLLDYMEPSVFAQSLYRVNKVQSEFGPSGFKQTLTGAVMIRSLRRNNDTFEEEYESDDDEYEYTPNEE